MQLNKGLNIDALPENHNDGDYHYARNMVLDETMQFPKTEHGTKTIDLKAFPNCAGIIEYNDGWFVFENNKIYQISDILDKPTIIKTIEFETLEFLPEHPVRGAVSNNFKNEMILMFSSGVNGNFEDLIFNIDKTDDLSIISKDKLKEISMNPETNIRITKVSKTDGMLLSGVYSFCVAEYINEAYSNPTLLTPPCPIYSHINGNTDKMGNSGYGFSVSVNSIRKYKLYVVYDDGKGVHVYSKEGNANSGMNIRNLQDWKTESLGDATIRTIPYPNSESMVVMDNILYRANLKADSSTNPMIHNIGKELAKSLRIDYVKTDTLDINNRLVEDVKFQDGEYYVLYLTLLDKKQNVIGTYPINTRNISKELSIRPVSDGTYYKMPEYKSFTERPSKSAEWTSLIEKYLSKTSTNVFKLDNKTFAIFGFSGKPLTDGLFTPNENGNAPNRLPYDDNDNPFWYKYQRSKIPITIIDSQSNKVNGCIYGLDNHNSYKDITFRNHISKAYYINDDGKVEYNQDMAMLSVRVSKSEYISICENGASFDSNSKTLTINNEAKSFKMEFQSSNYEDKPLLDYKEILDWNLSFDPTVLQYEDFKFNKLPDYENGVVLFIPLLSVKGVEPGVLYEDGVDINRVSISSKYAITSGFDYEDKLPPTLESLDGTSIELEANPIGKYGNFLNIKLPDDYESIIDGYSDYIGGFCIHRAVRNKLNSAIHSQGIVTGYVRQKEDVEPDTKYPIITSYWSAEGNNYHAVGDPWTEDELHSIRYNSFEDLFTRASNLYLGRVRTISSINQLFHLGDRYKNENFNIINKELSDNQWLDIKKNEYIESNNISQLNVGCDSTNVILGFTKNGTEGVISGEARANVYYNMTEFPYDAMDPIEQEIAICSLISELDGVVKAYGDTFYKPFKIRISRVDPYRKNKKWYFLVSEMDMDDKTGHAIYTATIDVESKFLLSARDRVVKYPKYDDYINPPNQAPNYNTVFNKQGNYNNIDVHDDSKYLYEPASQYPTRIISSVKNNPESKDISFRKFKALDYYDMPYNRDAIRALRTANNKMYIQQGDSLSLAFIKNVLSYDEGSTYIGSGQLFDRLPQEVLTTPHGFIGCESYYNNGICEMGYWCIDNKQGRIFLVTDDGAKIISSTQQHYFKDKLSGKNPFTKEGCSFLVYDNSRIAPPRLILVNTDLKYSMSYYPSIENWLSFHDIPNRFAFNTRSNLYYWDELGFDVYTKDNVAKYKDVTCQSILSIYDVDGIYNQRLESILWDTVVTYNDEQFDDCRDITFDKLMIHNKTQCTDYIDIKLLDDWFDVSNGVHRDSFWRFNNILDKVYIKDKPFLREFVNVRKELINNNLDWFAYSNFISKFNVVTMVANNQERAILNNAQPSILLRILEVNKTSLNK